MKALIMYKDRNIKYEEVDTPIPGDGEVLIRIEACGICGTDMHVFRGMECTWALPGIIGHEFSGTVVECGKNCKTILVGDHVTVQPLCSCGQCQRCVEKRTNLCEHVQLIGGERPGGFAEFAAVPAESIIKLPDEIPVKYGALAEPAATAVHASERLKNSHYNVIVIKGAGAIGLLILSVVRGMADVIVVSDIDEERLKVAKELGADQVIHPLKADLEKEISNLTDGKMADVVFDAAGEPGGKRQILRLVHPGAEIVLAALGNGEAEIDFTQVVTQELSIYGTQCHTRGDFHKALALMQSGKIQYEKIVTELPLEQGSLAFQNPGMGIKIHLFP